MKKIILLFILITIYSGKSSAQGMPVYDNTNFLALAQSLIESTKQTSELFKTVKFLKEQKERIEQVSNIVKQLQVVREIIDNNQRLYETVQQDLREILNSPYIRADEVDQISDSFNSLIGNALLDLEFSRDLLTSNFLNMTDAERLAILEAQRLRSREMIHEIELKKRRYRAIIEFREIKKSINNRVSNY
ncbi:conjugal transfer protein [Gramella sp. BOM4]|nr:conjugal transfer protein [Christiangramia bathymodioli]